MAVLDISALMSRHHVTISRYLQSKFMCTILKETGLPSKLNDRSNRPIVKHATVNQQSTSTTRRYLGLYVSLRRFQKVSQDTGYTELIKQTKIPFLTDNHNIIRVQWA